jgi:hypothetical protein
MNLENLKSEWSAMNDRMEKQEIFKQKIFCQMLNTKSDKSLGRLVAYEVIMLILTILFIPFLLYIFNTIGMEFVRMIAVVAIVCMAINMVWQGIKICVLSKIDFSKTLKNNLLNINKYAVYIKYEKLIGYYFVIPLVTVACMFHYVQIRASMYWWILMSCMFIAAILFVIYFYRLYGKNISTIQQNLEELQELKEA